MFSTCILNKNKQKNHGRYSNPVKIKFFSTLYKNMGNLIIMGQWRLKNNNHYA